MHDGYVAINGKRYREHLLAKIEELKPQAQEEECAFDEYTQMRDKFSKLPWWKVPPASLIPPSPSLSATRTLRDIERVLKGVADDLTYYISLDEASWLGFGEKEEEE